MNDTCLELRLEMTMSMTQEFWRQREPSNQDPRCFRSWETKPFDTELLSTIRQERSTERQLTHARRTSVLTHFLSSDQALSKVLMTDRMSSQVRSTWQDKRAWILVYTRCYEKHDVWIRQTRPDCSASRNDCYAERLIRVPMILHQCHSSIFARMKSTVSTLLCSDNKITIERSRKHSIHIFSRRDDTLCSQSVLSVLHKNLLNSVGSLTHQSSCD